MSRLFIAACVGVAGFASVALLLYSKGHEAKTRSAAGAEWAVGFSADFTSEDAGHPSKNCVGRMYVNALAEPRGMRREMVCGQRKRTAIWRQNGSDVVLDPDAKVYWKPHVETRLVAFTTKDRKVIGREKVNGRTQQQADGTSVIAQVWQDPKLHSPIRIVTPTSKYELENVKEGAQPESLFAVPDGFREVEPPKQ